MQAAISVAKRILSPRAVLTGASNGDSLENIIRPDNGAVCFVESEAALYYFVATSTTAVSAPDVIATGQGASVPGRWFKYAPGGGSTLTPLSEIFVVDPAAPALGTGAFSGNKAFTTVAEAIAAASTSVVTTILVSPGDYTGEGVLSYADKSIAFVGLGDPDTTVLPELHPSAEGFLRVTFQHVDATVKPGSAALIRCYDSNVDIGGVAANTCNFNGGSMTNADGTGVALLSARGGCDVIGPISVDGDVSLVGSNHTGGPLVATGTITANGCQVGALTSSAANIALVGCTVDGDLNAFADLLVMGSATIGARAYTATTIEIDTGSHAMVLANGGSFTGAVTIYG
jgi:hypothetical protein